MDQEAEQLFTSLVFLIQVTSSLMLNSNIYIYIIEYHIILLKK